MDDDDGVPGIKEESFGLMFDCPDCAGKPQERSDCKTCRGEGKVTGRRLDKLLRERLGD